MYLSYISSSSEGILGQIDGMHLHLVDMIHKQGLEVKNSEENFVDAWNFFLSKEDHDLTMMRENETYMFHSIIRIW
jgi:hypothetical protein